MARNKKSAPNKAAKELRADAKRQVNTAKKNSQKLAKEQIKALRPYMDKLKKVDLRKELTPAQKGFITKAWNEYTKLTTRGVKVYRSKNKDNLAAVQKYSRHGLDKSAPKFDVAFVPTALDKPKVKVDKKGRVEVSQGYVKETAIYFDIEKLVADPEAEIARVLSENPNSNQFILMAGEYTVNGGLDRGTLVRETLYWINRYSPGGDGYKRRGSNSYFANWLLGAIVVETKNQKDFLQWIKASKNKSNINKRQKSQQRAQFKRKYGGK